MWGVAAGQDIVRGPQATAPHSTADDAVLELNSGS